jgi:NAD-dependent dihydropyrimidine dehydrogenase PreA subunit
MKEQTWHGIPRDKIPRHPTIDYEKCTSCGKCMEYCTIGTYSFSDEKGKMKPIVKNPNNCVALCSGCDSICPEGAISHPLKKHTQEIIKGLRKEYPVKQAKG